MEAKFLWIWMALSICSCLKTVQAGCLLGCPRGEYCCDNECCELVQGISGQTWTYIGIGITAFLILLVVIFGCLCGRMIRAKRGNEGVVVTTYPQQNAMLNVVNTVPDAQMEKGISNAAYTGQPQVVNTPYVYTVQQQNPSGTPAAQPMKSSGFGYNGSYKMNQHYYAQAQKHKPVRASRKFAL